MPVTRFPDEKEEEAISIIQMGPVWYSETLAPNQRLIALALADFADDLGRCWPSMQRIADKTGYSRRQTSRVVKELREMGYVEIIEDATPRRSPRYLLHPDTITTPIPEARQSDTPPASLEGDDTGDIPEVTIRPPRHDTDDAPEVTPVSPEPSENHQDPSEEPPLEDDADMDQDALPIEGVERFTDEATDVIPRPRNRGYDALVALFGYEPEGSEASLFGKIASKANREANPEVAVVERATRLIAQWEAKALTPASLLKWWDRFGTPLGAATEEQAARLRDDLESQLRRQRAAELDAESAAQRGYPIEPDAVIEPSDPDDARDHVLDAVAELGEDDTDTDEEE